jgi:hypothetical protein
MLWVCACEPISSPFAQACCMLQEQAKQAQLSSPATRIADQVFVTTKLW